MVNLCLRLTWAFLAVMQPMGSGIGASVVVSEIRVTLLEARRLSLEEYREARKPGSAPWAGGGFRFTFLVENRPGAPLPPALGEVRVLVESKPYNAVTNAVSQKPFAPLIIIRDASDFLASEYGAALRARAPAPRPATVVSALEIFIPGAAIPAGTSGVVDLELGETYRPAGGRLRQLSPEEIAKRGPVFVSPSHRLIEFRASDRDGTDRPGVRRKRDRSRAPATPLSRGASRRPMVRRVLHSLIE